MSEEKPGIAAWLALPPREKSQVKTDLRKANLLYPGKGGCHLAAAAALEELSNSLWPVTACSVCACSGPSADYCARYDRSLPEFASPFSRPSWCKPGALVVIISDELSPDDIEDNKGDTSPSYTDSSCFHCGNNPPHPASGKYCQPCLDAGLAAYAGDFSALEARKKKEPSP